MRLGCTRALRPTGRPLHPLLRLATVLTLGVGCSDSNPKVLEAHEQLRVDPRDRPSLGAPAAPLSEEEKIRRLIQRVRTSGVVFIRNGREQTSFEAAAHLQSVQSKIEENQTAIQFIEQAANKAAVSGKPYQVRVGHADPMPAHEWLRNQLREIEEGRTSDGSGAGKTGSDVRAQGPPAAASEVTINDVLTIIEGSGAEFLAPQRKKQPKVYEALEFSKMLRQKWQWLGRGITDVTDFLDEIATDAFSSLEPYRIRFPDGREELLRPWLDRQIEAKRQSRSETAADRPKTP